MSVEPGFILTFQCADQPGIVSEVTTTFARSGYNIQESSQFRDPESNRFFMRIVYARSDGLEPDLQAARTLLRPLTARYDMQWSLRKTGERVKVLVAVSRWGHCLNMLLNTWKNRSMPIDIVGVVSNHETLREFTEWYGVEYHYLPIDADRKSEQEARLYDIFEKSGAELLVLARYMQILSDQLCAKLEGRAINIHHSFLPGFKGAKPYHQAYERGVKIIGATAHYVTADLDEGPIIEQGVTRTSHAETPQSLVEFGRDLEATVLNRAVKWHAEGRVALNGRKTVVFQY